MLPTNFQENTTDNLESTNEIIPSIAAIALENAPSLLTVSNEITKELNEFLKLDSNWRIIDEKEFTDTNLITESYDQKIFKKRYIFVNNELDDLYNDYFEIHVTGFLYYKDDMSCGLVCHSTINIDNKYDSKLSYLFDILNQNLPNKINIIKIHYGYEPIRYFKKNVWITFYYDGEFRYSFSLIDIRRRYPELETEFNTLNKVAKKIYYNFMKLVPELKCKHSENKRPIDSNFTYEISKILSKMI
jgi:hypothetical protein